MSPSQDKKGNHHHVESPVEFQAVLQNWVELEPYDKV